MVFVDHDEEANCATRARRVPMVEIVHQAESGVQLRHCHHRVLGLDIIGSMVGSVITASLLDALELFGRVP